ncbi:hypothetical protein L596_026021 [Steinernema carpocapsae]|uniref:Uncharacterized protein n=1 Tax=Steinernema carpocapsae TaxID=34508 RepID=A0A4U5M041_STECR|nr:hypothetical protein L596_026021 [Steinernema carpocapsae]
MALLRAVSLRSASTMTRPKANFQVTVDAKEQGHFQYERNISRDKRYANPQQQGDTPIRFLVRRLGHAYEVYPILVLTGWWAFLFCLATWYSFEKVEVWFDRSQDKAPWDWSRIAKTTTRRPPSSLISTDAPISAWKSWRKLQDEMMAAAKKRQAGH